MNIHGPSISKSKFFLKMQVSRSFACRQASPNVEAHCCGLSFPGHTLLFSGREASGQREVQLSSLWGAGVGGGGLLPQGVLPQVGAREPLHSRVMCPQDDPLQLQGRVWVLGYQVGSLRLRTELVLQAASFPGF